MITVEFKDFEDMMGFARALISTVEPKDVQPVVPQTQPTQVTPPPVWQEQPAQYPQTAPTQPAQTGQTPMPQAEPVTPPPMQPSPVQTAAPSYTADDLAKAAMALMDSGRQADLVNLLAQFGTDSLPHLPQEQYGAFATALRGLGAPI